MAILVTVHADHFPKTKAPTAGNRNRHIQLLLSLTDSTGAPVRGVDHSNVTIHSLGWMGRAGGAGLEMTVFLEFAFAAGFYTMSVMPSDADNWSSGKYVMGIVVKAGDGEMGQTMVDILIP
jgi:hypothetical protein